MSIFSDPQDTNLLTDIEVRANPVGKTMMKPLLFVFIGAAIGMIAGGPVVAGAMAAIPAWTMIKGLRSDVDNNQFTRRHPGTIAHLISSERDMMSWIESKGIETVKAQLLLALQSGQPLTATAKRIAAAFIPANQVPAANLKTYIDQLTNATGANHPTVSAMLGVPSFAGVPVAGAASSGAIVPALAGSLSVNGAVSDPGHDVATDLGTKPQSALIFGTPGSGKGMNISNAIRTLKSKFPNVTVMMVDPKGDAKERGYWESQVDIFESRELLKSSPRSSAEWMIRCVDKFVAIKGQKLLVWDELFATVTVLKSQNAPKDDFPCLTNFQQFLSTHFSLGPSSGVWIWGMSQSANLSDLGLTSGGLSTTRIIALVSPDNVGAVEGYLATKAIVAPKRGMVEINELMEESLVKRACYDGKTKKWYPMAKLVNHSGFDRDKADWNAISQTPLQPGPQTIDIPAQVIPTEPTERELKEVGRTLAGLISKQAQGQPVDSAIVGAIATQSALAGNGQFKEAIQTMIPHVCPSPDAFLVIFPGKDRIAAYLGVK